MLWKQILAILLAVLMLPAAYAGDLNEELLIAAIHVEVVRALLDKGADGSRVLAMAASMGRIEMVEAIISKGGLKPEILSSALSAAKRNKQSAIVELLRKAGAVPPPEPVPVDAETLKAYAGIYKGPDGMEFTFSLKDGRFMGGPSTQTPFALQAIDKLTFRPSNFEGLTVTFSLENGKVVGLTLKQGGNSTAYKKVE